jgi:kumamolisin
MAKSPRFAEQPCLVLPGSEKAAAPTAVTQKPTPPKSKLTVSVIVKRKQPLKINRRGGRASGPVRVTPAEFKKQHAADPAAITLVRAFAREFNLKVEPDPTSVMRRTIRLTGAAADMKKAFGVVLEQKTIHGVEYRVREGVIHLPASLIDSVVAFLGLDNRPQANPHFRIRQPHAVSTSYTAVQVAQAYQFPATASGAGQTIGIIELGGGYRQTDLTAYFKTLGLAASAVTAVSVDGEVMLDIEVFAAVAHAQRLPSTSRRTLIKASSMPLPLQSTPPTSQVRCGRPAVRLRLGRVSSTRFTGSGFGTFQVSSNHRGSDPVLGRAAGRSEWYKAAESIDHLPLAL